jgi:hypothetical protein
LLFVFQFSVDTITDPRNTDNHDGVYDLMDPMPLTNASCQDEEQSLEPLEVSEPASQLAIEQTLAIEKEDQSIPELDDVALEILGADPSTTVMYAKDIQKDLAVRFEHIATAGLTKELRKEFLETYLPPANCKLIDAPSLNPEIKAAINETSVKRDKAMHVKQKQIGSAISCLSQAISIILLQETKDKTVLKLLMDTGRILCDCQHYESSLRRNFVMAVLKKELKDQIQLTKIDSLLFGQDLADTLKTAKAINKSGAELKVSGSTPRNFTGTSRPKPTPTSRNLNWKAPAPSRRPSGFPKAKEPVASTRQQPAPSSRPSRGRPSTTTSTNRGRR